MFLIFTFHFEIQNTKPLVTSPILQINQQQQQQQQQLLLKSSSQNQLNIHLQVDEFEFINNKETIENDNNNDNDNDNDNLESSSSSSSSQIRDISKIRKEEGYKDKDFEELVEYKTTITTFPKQIIPTVIFYNRIGKAGSSTLKAWINHFSTNFHYSTSSITEDEACLPETFLTTEYPTLINQSASQNIIERHIYYINFTKFGYYPQPSYINLMRHPGSRYISQYHYWRSLRSSFGDTLKSLNYSIEYCLESSISTLLYGCPMLNYQTAYFCGTDDRCTYPMSEEGYLLARENMIQHYDMVGILEYLNTTTAVLRHLYPTYFDTSALLEKLDHSNARDVDRYHAKVHHPERHKEKGQNYPPPSDELLEFAALLNWYDYKLYHLALEILRLHAISLNFNFVPSDRF